MHILLSYIVVNVSKSSTMHADVWNWENEHFPAPAMVFYGLWVDCCPIYLCNMSMVMHMGQCWESCFNFWIIHASGSEKLQNIKNSRAFFGIVWWKNWKIHDNKNLKSYFLEVINSSNSWVLIKNYFIATRNLSRAHVRALSFPMIAKIYHEGASFIRLNFSSVQNYINYSVMSEAFYVYVCWGAFCVLFFL